MWVNIQYISCSILSTKSLISKTLITILEEEDIIPDCDCHPSVIIDVLACSCIQHLTATTSKFSNEASILKEHMKELIHKVLVLSWNGKKMWLAKTFFFCITKFNTLCKLRHLWHYLKLNSQDTDYRKIGPLGV